jgi:hypothetical protein
MRKSKVFLPLLVASILIGSAIVSTAQNPPATATYFVCPTVSTNNGNGMWVIGYHGGYYVLIPKKGGDNDGSKVFLTIPVKVFSVAQIPAGWGLYSSLPSYPNFVGTAVLLQEGIDHWLGSPVGWQEGDMAVVSSNGGGTYTVTDLTLTASSGMSQQVEIKSPIPLASGAVW